MKAAADPSLVWPDWPHRDASRFVEAAGLRWHVQVMGRGPVALLLHGTGASTHSWRDLAPLLAQRCTIVAPDLPGHGGTSPPARHGGYALPAVARATTALCEALALRPRYLIGHSAGAAIAVRMALDLGAPPEHIVGINAALLPFPGPFGAWAPLLARGFFYNPFVVALFRARASQPGAVRKLIESTGSHLDERGLEFYERLFRRSAHLEGALGLMAHWDLSALRLEMRNLKSPLALFVGENDRAVRPDTVEALRGVVPRLQIRRLEGLGHLAHEEAPDRVAAEIFAHVLGLDGAADLSSPADRI